MRDFLRVAIYSTICCAVFGEQQGVGLGVNINLASLLRPQLWSSDITLSTPLRKRNQVANGYLVTNVYESSNKCGGEPASVFGYGMGVCFIGFDSNGTIVGSVMYSYDGVDDVSDSMKITKQIYPSDDCSGTHDDEHMGVPRKCWTGKDADDSNEYKYLETSEPWSGLGNGLLLK